MEKNKNLLNKIKFSTKFNNSSDIQIYIKYLINYLNFHQL